MFKRPKVVAPPPPPKPAGSGFRSITAGEARSMANRNQPAPTPGVVPIPTNLPKMSGPLGSVAPNSVNKNQPSMTQLQSAANAIRGLRQPATQQIMNAQRGQIATQAPAPAGVGLGGRSSSSPMPPQLGLLANATRGLPKMGGMGMKKGGEVKAKKMASGGKVSSASSRGDGCAIKGKTKGRMV